MTYAQAKMIVWNCDAYAANVVREAAIFILSRIDAAQEDIDQATSVL